jgi:hypothetical protein
METYVLDKTFYAIGSIGTGVAVRLGLGTPSNSKYRNYVKTIAGTLTVGSVPAIGISVTGCSETGKEVIVRLVGIAKAKIRATSGTIIQGKPFFAATKGKLQLAANVRNGGQRSGTTHPIVGYCVNAEGYGSPDCFIDLLVSPQYI